MMLSRTSRGAGREPGEQDAIPLLPTAGNLRMEQPAEDNAVRDPHGIALQRWPNQP